MDNEGDAGSEELARLNDDAISVSQKTPDYGPYEGFMDDEAVLGEPDLAEYFAQWELSDAGCIAICRTYANYLAAKTRPKKYLKRTRTEVAKDYSGPPSLRAAVMACNEGG